MKEKEKGSALKELCITASLKEDAMDCIQHTQMQNIEFIWNKDISKRFMWILKHSHIEEEYVLDAKLKCGTKSNKVQLKIQFEIENDAVSTIQIEADDSHKHDNYAQIVNTVKNMRSGEFIVR